MKICCIKFTITIILSLLFTGCIPSDNNSSMTPTVGEEKISWTDSIDNGKKEAIASQKLLLIHFYTTWSDWSKKMDLETYTYYKVINLSKNFVCVKIDIDKHPELESKYGITGNPTVIFEDPVTGKCIKKLEGIRDRHELTREMTDILSYKVKVEGGAKGE